MITLFTFLLAESKVVTDDLVRNDPNGKRVSIIVDGHFLKNLKGITIKIALRRRKSIGIGPRRVVVQSRHGRTNIIYFSGFVRNPITVVVNKADGELLRAKLGSNRTLVSFELFDFFGPETGFDSQLLRDHKLATNHSTSQISSASVDSGRGSRLGFRDFRHFGTRTPNKVNPNQLSLLLSGQLTSIRLIIEFLLVGGSLNIWSTLQHFRLFISDSTFLHPTNNVAVKKTKFGRVVRLNSKEIDQTTLLSVVNRGKFLWKAVAIERHQSRVS